MARKLWDQREIYGHPFANLAEVEAFWARFLHDHRGITSFTVVDDELPAYVSAGRWVALCPYCNAGIGCWDQNPRGCCLECGTVYRIRFPAPAERAIAEPELLSRPKRHQHWFPHLGEKAETLPLDRGVAELGLAATLLPASMVGAPAEVP